MTLQLDDVHLGSKLPRSGGIVLKHPRNKLVFLVEDEISQRRLCRFFLEDAGFEVRDFSNAEAALEALLHRRPAAICVDQQLPRMSGIDCISACRSLSPQTAILLLSATSDSEFLNEISTAPIDGFLPKPVDRRSLTEEVERIIAEKSRAEPGVPN